MAALSHGNAGTDKKVAQAIQPVPLADAARPEITSAYDIQYKLNACATSAKRH